MSLLFLQPAPYHYYNPRRIPRGSCHCGMPCGMPGVYGDYSYPHPVYTLRMPQPRPSPQLPLFAHILSSLLQGEKDVENQERPKAKEDPASTKASSSRQVAEHKHFEAKFHVKGFSPDEINVSIKENKFVEVHAKHEEESENGCSYREYKRVVQLPQDADSQQVMPVLSTDGILTLRVPMPQAVTQEDVASKDSDVQPKEDTENHEASSEKESSPGCTTCEDDRQTEATATTIQDDEVTEVLSDSLKHTNQTDEDFTEIEREYFEDTEGTDSAGQKDEVTNEETLTQSVEGIEEVNKSSDKEVEVISSARSLDDQKPEGKTIKIDIIHE